MSTPRTNAATMIVVSHFVEGKPFTMDERAHALAVIGEVRDFAALGRAAYAAMLRTEVARLQMRRADALQEVAALVGHPVPGVQ